MQHDRFTRLFVFAPLAAAALYACADSGSTTSNSGGAGGSSTSSFTASISSSSQASSSSSASSSATASASAASSSASSSSASASSSSSAAGGAGGSGGGAAGGAGGAGGGFVWPTCDMQPAGSTLSTIHDVWTANYATPTPVWIPGVYVTAISGSACAAGVACQIFVQQDLQYADLAAGSQQAIKMFISANTAKYFTSVKLNDQVDAYGYAWRYDVSGQNELLLEVNLKLPGCAKTVGAGTAQPVAVSLSDLTVSAYEDTVGPLLVTVPTVSGKPGTPAETFGLWPTGMFPADASVEDFTSLSPYMLPGNAFTGLTDAHTTDFSSVTGVFGLFLPSGGSDAAPVTKYKEIYPRSAAEYPILTVH